MTEYTVIIILTLLLLIVASVSDDLTATIPHTVMLGLFGLGITGVFIDYNCEKGLTLLLFGMTFAILITLFVILGEDAIGGADIKVMTISILFLHNSSDILTYFIAFGLFSIIAYIKLKIEKKKYCRYGKYMSLGLLPVFFKEVDEGLLAIIGFLLIVLILDNLLERSCGDKDEKIYFIY